MMDEEQAKTIQRAVDLARANQKAATTDAAHCVSASGWRKTNDDQI